MFCYSLTAGSDPYSVKLNILVYFEKAYTNLRLLHIDGWIYGFFSVELWVTRSLTCKNVGPLEKKI